MKFSPKHKRVVSAQLRAGARTVILDGEKWSVKDAAKQMGIKTAPDSKKDKYRTQHADLEQTLHTRHTEDSGDGTSEE